MKKSSDTIGNRTCDLPACSSVPQPTAPPRAPNFNMSVTCQRRWTDILFNIPGVHSADYIIIQDIQSKYNITTRRVRATIVAVGKKISITYSECVFVVLVIQHEKRMCNIILSPMACLAVPYFHII